MPKYQITLEQTFTLETDNIREVIENYELSNFDNTTAVNVEFAGGGSVYDLIESENN